MMSLLEVLEEVLHPFQSFTEFFARIGIRNPEKALAKLPEGCTWQHSNTGIIQEQICEDIRF